MSSIWPRWCLVTMAILKGWSDNWAEFTSQMMISCNRRASWLVMESSFVVATCSAWDRHVLGTRRLCRRVDEIRNSTRGSTWNMKTYISGVFPFSRRVVRLIFQIDTAVGIPICLSTWVAKSSNGTSNVGQEQKRESYRRRYDLKNFWFGHVWSSIQKHIYLVCCMLCEMMNFTMSPQNNRQIYLCRIFDHE